jgi:hypothetical protein
LNKINHLKMVEKMLLEVRTYIQAYKGFDIGFCRLNVTSSSLKIWRSKESDSRASGVSYFSNKIR